MSEAATIPPRQFTPADLYAARSASSASEGRMCVSMARTRRSPILRTFPPKISTTASTSESKAQFCSWSVGLRRTLGTQRACSIRVSGVKSTKTFASSCPPSSPRGEDGVRKCSCSTVKMRHIIITAWSSTTGGAFALLLAWSNPLTCSDTRTAKGTEDAPGRGLGVGLT